MRNKLFLLLPIVLLSGCGSRLNEFVDAKLDHSPVFVDNYYYYFDSNLRTQQFTEITLDKKTNKVFTSYDDDNFKDVEPHYADYSYQYDIYGSNGYGPNHKLSLYNEDCKRGFVSKLFDGQMFCNGYHERARVQISPIGFSNPITSDISKATYLFLNFKSALDFKNYTEHDPHLDDITLHITFYGDTNIRYTYSLKDVPTNYYESPSAYTFFGFSLKNNELKNIHDFSIEYNLDSDPEQIVGQSHSLLLYEFGFGGLQG